MTATPAEGTTTVAPAAHGSESIDPRVARSRASLLAAATELLVEGGPRAVTVDAVAARSGVAKSTLYRHWESVQDLLVDVLRANVPPELTVDPEAEFEPALRAWTAHAAASLASPEWVRILPALMMLRSHSPEVAEVLAADFDEKFTAITEILRRGSAEGRLPADLDPRLVTHTLAGPLVLAALGTGGRDATLATLADYVVDRFLASYDPAVTGGTS
jgi:AcrR family transcriptional regulator